MSTSVLSLPREITDIVERRRKIGALSKSRWARQYELAQWTRDLERCRSLMSELAVLNEERKPFAVAADASAEALRAGEATVKSLKELRERARIVREHYEAAVGHCCAAAGELQAKGSALTDRARRVLELDTASDVFFGEEAAAVKARASERLAEGERLAGIGNALSVLAAECQAVGEELEVAEGILSRLRARHRLDGVRLQLVDGRQGAIREAILEELAAIGDPDASIEAARSVLDQVRQLEAAARQQQDEARTKARGEALDATRG